MMFVYEWPDKTVTILEAFDEGEAYSLLDQIGDVESSRLKVFEQQFMMTFKVKTSIFKEIQHIDESVEFVNADINHIQEDIGEDTMEYFQDYAERLHEEESEAHNG